jgi:5-oxoprolinase (ATP-hydrolysing) subunit A
MSRSIDLNADLGEGMPWDGELLQLVTSANVSCGAHAGTPEQIAATLAEAKRRGVIVGAHPSWPDREGFGRVERTGTAREVEVLVLEQVAALRALAGPLGVAIRYIKPHGAMYNQAMRTDPGSTPISDGLILAADRLDLPVMGQPNSWLHANAAAFRLPYISEGFPDRAYQADGRLVPRSVPGALIEGVEAVVAQALRLADQGFDSLCLHGDSPEAVARAQAIRSALDRAGIAVRSFLSPAGDG